MFVRLNSSTIIRDCENGQVLILNLATGGSILCSEEAKQYISPLSLVPVLVKNVAMTIASQCSDADINEIESDLVEFYKTASEHKLVTLGSTMSDTGEYTLQSLHVEITYKCNERCIHCYIPNYTKDNGAFIDETKFYKLVDEFVCMDGQEITISGGEPMLHPHFRDMVKYCCDKEVRVNIFSNLMLCNDDMCDFLANAKIHSVQTSLYSMSPDIHDKITGVSGSLNRTLSAIENLAYRGINVSLACPIMKHNMDGAIDIVAYAKSMGMALRLNPMLMGQTDGNTKQLYEIKLDPQSQRQLLENLLAYDKEYVVNNLLELNLDAENDLINTTEEYLNEPICSAAIDHICVSANGDFYPCPGWDSYIVGNISKDKLVDVWFTNPKLNHLRYINRKSRFTECLKCSKLRYCKRCFLQSNIENSFGKFSQRSCDEAEQRCGILRRWI